MKKLYILLFLIIGTAGQAQTVNIPDQAFLSKLLEANVVNYIAEDNEGHSVKIDVNGDGLIQNAEAENIKRLTIVYDFGQKVTSIQGIEDFVNLSGFTIIDSEITSLVSFLPASISYLKLDKNTGLSTVSLFGLSNLTEIYFGNCTTLTSLNAGSMPNLRALTCGNNNIMQTINFQGSTNLEYLKISNINIDELNLAGLTNLKRLECISTNIPFLNVQELSNLSTLICQNNYQLESLDVSGQQQLSDFDCSDNALTELTLGVKTELYSFSCNNNNLTYLDLSNCTDLEFVSCGFNNLQYINSKNNINTIVELDGLAATNQPVFMCVDEGEEDFLLTYYKTNPYYSANYDDLALLHMSDYCNSDTNKDSDIITGRLTYDADDNGCAITDSPIYMPVLLSNDETSATDIVNYNGHYDFFVPAGTYTITPQLENDWFTVIPASVTITVNENTPDNINVQDFCITANGVHPDVEIHMEVEGEYPIQQILGYYVYVTNKGTEIQSGTVSVTDHSENIYYYQLQPNMPHTVLPANVVTWEYSDLKPFETRRYRLLYKGLNNYQVETFSFTAAITPAEGDETPANNTFNLTVDMLGTQDVTKASKLKIYPNPVQSIININPGNEVLNKIELYDLQGRLLQTETPAAGNATVDVSARANGVYLLRVYSDKGNTVHKIIKK